MGRGRHMPEQIITALREAEVGLASGKTAAMVSRELGITEQTYYRWRKEFGGYCQLVAAGGAFGRWEIEIAQAAVAALHSLKERSRNSR